MNYCLSNKILQLILYYLRKCCPYEISYDELQKGDILTPFLFVIYPKYAEILQCLGECGNLHTEYS